MKELKELHGHLNATGMRFGIIISRFNELIGKNLLAGCIDGLLRHGANREKIVIAWVPGAFETPVAAKKMAQTEQFDALICLGVVIRGATTHYDFVAGQNAAGINKAATDCVIPVMYGVLTCDNIEQALERSGSKSGNKGYDVAVGAIEMVDLFRQIDSL
jgi:6,7-dimethyl-8-ribityllumazine synthase